MKKPSSAFLDRFKKKKSSADFQDEATAAAESKSKLEKATKEAEDEAEEVKAAQAKEAAEEAKKKEAEENAAAKKLAKKKEAAEESKKKEAEEKAAAEELAKKEAELAKKEAELAKKAAELAKKKASAEATPPPLKSLGGSSAKLLDQAADMASGALQDFKVAMGVSDKPSVVTEGHRHHDAPVVTEEV